jgi:hypothetical protein
MVSTSPIAAGSAANRKRSGNGTDSTHWRTGSRGSTSSTSSAALSTIRRAPQLGQKRRRLQLKATSRAAWQVVQWTRRKPCSRRPHFRYASNSSWT